MSELNQNKKTEVVFNDFSGGHCGTKAPGTLKANEAKAVDNIVVLPSGAGFRSRLGNDEHIIIPSATSQSALGATYGISLFEYQGDNWLVSCSDSGGLVSNEVYVKSANIAQSSSATDSVYATATYTFTNNNLIQLIKVNNLIVGIVLTTGTSYIPPFQAAMSASGGLGSFTLFSGSVADGRFGIFWNNRLWIGNFTGAESKIKYSILAASGVSFATSTTWTDTGSGFVEPARGDGDEVVAMAPISNNVLLAFKKRSIHQIVGRSDPFAVFPLFSNVGAAGRGCVVEAEGLIYFITPDKKMRITDGSKIFDEKDLPKLNDAQDLWDTVSTSRLYLTLGFRHQGKDFDWIVWICSTGGSSTHNSAIIWDRINQCWLYCSTGFNANAVTSLAGVGAYIGGYSNARIYKLNASATYQDDSYSTPLFDGSNRQLVGTDPQAITWQWHSDDFIFNSLEKLLNAEVVKVSTKLTGTGSLDFAYRYNGLSLSSTVSKSLNPSSANYVTTAFRPLGRGQTFGIKLFGDDNIGYQINGYSLTGQQKGWSDSNKGLV